MASRESQRLQDRLQNYLYNELATGHGFFYVKSRYIAAELGVSVKRVGATMAALEADESTPFVISRRGGSSDGTTWCVEARSINDH